MKSFTITKILFCLFTAGLYSQQSTPNETLSVITQHYLNVIKESSSNSLKLPRSIKEDGSIRFVSSKDWTSGFFPGTLWQLYIFSGDKQLRQAAIEWTELVRDEQFNNSDHDIGFKIMCSFGQGYRATNDDDYKKVIITAAKTLSTLFNPKVGAIQSWTNRSDLWVYPVIIDNMMNLELLFAATELTGDSTFYNIAVKHADTTLKNHFRNDNSSYHVLDYDPHTGEVIKKQTHQGYSDESAWARGQSWGLYGFTMMYRFTKDEKYLNQAKAIAAFLMNHPNKPDDFVPYWDYNSPDIPNTHRDVSAGAIMASALYELSEISNNDNTYIDFADNIVSSIYNKYRLNDEGKPFFTTSSVGNFNKSSEIAVPINYADYYFIEALMRRKAMDN